ncbi:hypothetical protein Mucpa_5769 [Mucilaginibacter paludis DSM 18603]|uniref:Uncharacterized protein n=1 Tax=Mucilaginibacter paludis DSM 18603 TaxID=714943 RepID=H1Y5R1_9SPHI|nr:hypothetical protein Mucpa_5769 [Mucilaginibacter paludis DSM 18603]
MSEPCIFNQDVNVNIFSKENEFLLYLQTFFRGHQHESLKDLSMQVKTFKTTRRGSSDG